MILHLCFDILKLKSELKKDFAIKIAMWKIEFANPAWTKMIRATRMVLKVWQRNLLSSCRSLRVALGFGELESGEDENYLTREQTLFKITISIEKDICAVSITYSVLSTIN